MAMEDDVRPAFNPYINRQETTLNTEEIPTIQGIEARDSGADAFATGGGAPTRGGSVYMASQPSLSALTSAHSQPSLSHASWEGQGADQFATGGGFHETHLPTGRQDSDSLIYAPGRRLLGRYLLQARIGEGGMGEVWQAQDLQSRRAVALKRIHPMMLCDAQALGRFARESELLLRLSHPSIVRIYEHHLAHGFFVMELLPGQDLASWQQHKKRFALLEMVEILSKLTQGLGEIHAHGLIHRDIKPTNIRLHWDEERHGWQVKLMDFGIAWSAEGRQLTATRGALVGSPYYIAPELLHGSAVPSPKADVYSLGVLFYELLTGEIPLAGALSLEEAAAHMLEDGTITQRECPPEVRREYLQIMRREATLLMRGALARDPRQRNDLATLSRQLDQLKRSYRALRETGQRRRQERIKQFLLAACEEEAQASLHEAASLYPESKAWAQLARQIRAESEGRARLSRRLTPAWRATQTQRRGRKRRREEASIRKQWEDAVSRSPWPQLYRNDPFNLQVNPPQSTRTQVPWWHTLPWREELESILILAVILAFLAFLAYLLW